MSLKVPNDSSIFCISSGTKLSHTTRAAPPKKRRPSRNFLRNNIPEEFQTLSHNPPERRDVKTKIQIPSYHHRPEETQNISKDVTALGNIDKAAVAINEYSGGASGKQDLKGIGTDNSTREVIKKIVANGDAEVEAILKSVDTKTIFEMVNNLKEKYSIDGQLPLSDDNGVNKKSSGDVSNDVVKKDSSDIVVQDGSKSFKLNKSSHHIPRSTRASRLRAGEKDGVKSPQGTPPSSRSSSQSNKKTPPSTKRTPSPASSDNIRRATTSANSVARKDKTATETSAKKTKSTASSKELASSPFARRQARLKAEAAAAEASKTNEKGNFADKSINAAKSS